jgi:transcriptional regulator with XRE-family HTH domain
MSDRVDVMVGLRLRRRRRLMGLTQQQLAAICGVSFQQVQKYECAYNRLSVAMLWKLACALEVDIGYFFTGLSRDADLEDARRRRAGEPRTLDVQPSARDRARDAA